VLTLDNPFWKFSLAVYAAPEVAAECLALQRELDIDINVLLFCAFMGNTHKILLDQDDLTRTQNHVRTWHETSVRPLRKARQDIKPMPAMSDPAVKALRDDIAKSELRAEQIEQAMLFELAGKWIDAAAAGSAAEAVRHNVRDFLTSATSAGAPPRQAEHLIAQAIAYRPS
jgi:uncharacterized protein (TIGR02444 family)